MTRTSVHLVLPKVEVSKIEGESPIGNLGYCSHHNTTLVLETPVVIEFIKRKK